MIRILSHAEIFSFAAFKCLQSENMDSKVLLEILKSMSMAVTDTMSLATAQTLGLPTDETRGGHRIGTQRLSDFRGKEKAPPYSIYL